MIVSQDTSQLDLTRPEQQAHSETDIYELPVAGQAEPREIEWVVRTCQNRAT